MISEFRPSVVADSPQESQKVAGRTASEEQELRDHAASLFAYYCDIATDRESDAMIESILRVAPDLEELMLKTPGGKEAIGHYFIQFLKEPTQA